MNEDFEDGNIDDWTIEDGFNDGFTWELVQNRGTSSLDGSYFMLADSDEYSGIHYQEGLITPVMSIPSPQGQLKLTFDHYYNDLSSLARVDVFDGINWVEVKTYIEDVGSWETPANEEIDITSYANENLKIRFYYDDNNIWAWYWAIDNVKVEDVINE